MERKNIGSNLFQNMSSLADDIVIHWRNVKKVPKSSQIFPFQSRYFPPYNQCCHPSKRALFDLFERKKNFFQYF
jgi:hypothetical protein